tara:strand:+ start:406 stop:732 length:327 start_codon:yes stop_codon:yes gene_type:complete
MTRNEQTYYNNIERIAVALETLVIEAKSNRKDQKIDQLKKTANLIYGNDSSGRSPDNYKYQSFQPDIQSDLDARIHKESQSITGGEFSNWHRGLTSEERESYSRIYGH